MYQIEIQCDGDGCVEEEKIGLEVERVDVDNRPSAFYGFRGLGLPYGWSISAGGAGGHLCPRCTRIRLDS